MSSKGWKTYSLGEICVDVSYGYTASADINPVGPKFLRITDIQDYFVNWDRVPYCKISVNDLKKYKLETGDIVIARTGATTGTTYTLKEDVEAVFASYLIRFKINKEIAIPFYVEYILKSNLWKGFVESIIGGSAQPGANAKQFSNFQIPLPPLATQHRIASILSTIDNNIELNYQTNQTLEDIIKTIFKEWFINFNFPGATGEMQDNPMGHIPKGWKVGKIKDFTKKIQYGLTQSASNDEVGPHFLRITDIQSGKINWDSVPYCIVDKKDFEKYKIEDYDVFIARTGASTGENVLVISPPKAVFASYLIRIQFERPELALFIGKFLRTRQYFEFINSIKSGSAQPNANAQQLTDIEIVVPTNDLLIRFSQIVDSFERLKADNQYQSQTLTQIRDNLLPKLINGEIAV